MHYDPHTYIAAVTDACIAADMTRDAAARLVARHVLACIDRYLMDDAPATTAVHVMRAAAAAR